MLKLLYITNDKNIAEVAEKAGIDRIFVDLEILGKEARQAGRNTLISRHNIEDIKDIRGVVTTTELLVRINPLNTNSADEIEEVIKNGADIIMLPMFKSDSEVKKFIELVNGRVKTCLLLENKTAMDNLDKILEVEGINEFHIGLNDLHISMGKKFMFELISDGTVEKIVNKIKCKGIPVGVGGMSKLGTGILPAELILGEHYRIKSDAVILSRGFSENLDLLNNCQDVDKFMKNVKEIRTMECILEKENKDFFIQNQEKFKNAVNYIVSGGK